MAQNDILMALEKEEQALLRELEKLDVFKRLEAIRQVIALYKETLPPASRKPTLFGRLIVDSRESPTAIMAREAEKYLDEVRRRHTSGPLVKALRARGVEIPGKNPSARLASVLASKRKIFNNVEGQGYGLVKWGDVKTSEKKEESEAPDPARPGAPKSNGGVPLNH